MAKSCGKGNFLVYLQIMLRLEAELKIKNLMEIILDNLIYFAIHTDTEVCEKHIANWWIQGQK